MSEFWRGYLFGLVHMGGVAVFLIALVKAITSAKAFEVIDGG